ncbi:MAG: cysteine hydrolase family protein [Nitrososphaerales archaeon]
MNIESKNPPQVSIDTVSSALIVIDMQRAFLETGPLELPGGHKIVKGIERLIKKCRELGIVVVFTRIFHDDMTHSVYPELFPDHFDQKGNPRLTKKSPSFQITSELQPTKSDIIIDKSRYSAFYKTKLESILFEKEARTLIVVGLATNVCCESTARDAFFRNFRVVVVSDLCATYDTRAHEASLDNIRNCFGFVVNSKQMNEMLSQTKTNNAQKQALS